MKANERGHLFLTVFVELLAVVYLAGSPAYAETPQVAEGAAKRCVSNPMAGVGIQSNQGLFSAWGIEPSGRDISLGPLGTLRQSFNPDTRRYETSGWSHGFNVGGFGVNYTDQLGGVCLGYGDEVDRFVEGLK